MGHPCSLHSLLFLLFLQQSRTPPTSRDWLSNSATILSLVYYMACTCATFNLNDLPQFTFNTITSLMHPSLMHSYKTARWWNYCLLFFYKLLTESVFLSSLFYNLLLNIPILYFLFINKNKTEVSIDC